LDLTHILCTNANLVTGLGTLYYGFITVEDGGAGVLGVTTASANLSYVGNLKANSLTLVTALPVPSGGTGATTLTGVLIGHGTSAVTGNAVTQYDVLIGGASNAISSIGPGTAGQVLQSSGNAANPAYSTATYPATAGTSGNVLTSNGTNWVSSAPAAPAGTNVLISSQTVSGVASVVFTSGFGGYSYYIFEGYNITDSVANEAINIQVSTDAGASYSATTYTQQGNLSFNSASVSQSSTTWLVVNNSSSTASVPASFRSRIYGLDNNTTNKYIATHATGFVPTLTVSNIIASGQWATTTTVNALRVIAASGNLTGTFRLFGVV
jgi:hypothetical protein